MGVEVITFGCRLNSVESESMLKAARAAGQDDLVIVNTCAVTQEAVRQARQALRRLRRERPGARIVVTGCAAQIEPERFAQMAEVDHVLGNTEKLQPEIWLGLAAPHSLGQRVQVSDIMGVRETAPHLLDGFSERTRAFVQVQNGCDHRCTFCVIPYGRGNSRSVAMGAVVEQVRRLADNGYSEIVLTGVDITSWGADLPGAPKLGTLVQAVLRHVPGLARLRLSSIDSVEADDALLDAIAGEARLMPHLHLSLQAGDDMILKRMKRRHLRADAVRFCETVRALRPGLAIGADLIAGFPTETEEMFQRSLALVTDCAIDHLHVFPYSPRPGTPAAKMPQVPRELVRERARRLRVRGQEAFASHLQAQVGRDHRILVETASLGRTEGFTPVCLDGLTAISGSIVRLRIAGHDGRALLPAMAVGANSEGPPLDAPAQG